MNLEQTGEGFIPSRTTNPNMEGGLIIQSEDNIKGYSQEHNRMTLPLDKNNKPQGSGIAKHSPRLYDIT